MARTTSCTITPGPRPYPLIENLLDMPTSQEWLTFAKWGQTWGDIVSVSVFGQRMVILNSAKVASEMLDKKSSIYSDRPVMQMGGELCGWKDTLVLVPYGDRFRNYRKYFHQTIGSASAMAEFHPVEEQETRKFVKRILQNPDALAEHVRRTAGAIILRISHGYHIAEENDPFVRLADEATEQFSLSTAPGGFLVNIIPALRHVPEWFPGAGFHQTAKAWKKTLHEMADGPHRFVKQQLASGTAEPSLTSRLLSENVELTSVREHEIKWSAASMYSGGADTTVSSIYSLFIALLLFPEAQRKAQRELDRVVGNDRLPTFEDRPNLPYTNALALEVLRWHSVTPTGVPHTLMEDDVHEGYFIPKGTMIIANVWKMLHDERVYQDPFRFNPERFIGANPEPSPLNVCFGFGRRSDNFKKILIKGRVLAEASVFITCAMTLATSNIDKHKEGGKVVEPVYEQTTGTIR
ncbi:cytochrome P450 [Panaeolus papilionaceus]|nr:cytochrome P450 [Panaeolus papilionaceus]